MFTLEFQQIAVGFFLLYVSTRAIPTGDELPDNTILLYGVFAWSLVNILALVYLVVRGILFVAGG